MLSFLSLRFFTEHFHQTVSHSSTSFNNDLVPEHGFHLVTNIHCNVIGKIMSIASRIFLGDASKGTIMELAFGWCDPMATPPLQQCIRTRWRPTLSLQGHAENPLPRFLTAGSGYAQVMAPPATPVPPRLLLPVMAKAGLHPTR
jgi:hypothetical protein